MLPPPSVGAGDGGADCLIRADRSIVTGLIVKAGSYHLNGGTYISRVDRRPGAGGNLYAGTVGRSRGAGSGARLIEGWRARPNWLRIDATGTAIGWNSTLVVDSVNREKL